ncbi:S1 family peptidase, partial [Actinoplanes philippinensis]
MRRNKKSLLAVVTAGAVAVTNPWAGVPAQAAGATAASDYDFVAKIEVGVPGASDARGCSGALVRAEWVLTSAACFARNGVPLANDVPPLTTTITVGRPDLTTGTGQVLTATRVVSRSDRDVALVRLNRAVTGLTPIVLGDTAPAVGEVWRIAGYGRTRSEWIPTHQHAGDVTVESAASAPSVRLTNTRDVTVCRGDSGGPVFREANGRQLLMGVATSSGQAGCLGAGEDAPTGVVSTRVDDLNDWIDASTSTPLRPRIDFNNDGNAD